MTDNREYEVVENVAAEMENNPAGQSKKTFGHVVDKMVDNRRIYMLSVRRAYLREQKASLALPFVPVGTGTPEISVLSGNLSQKIKNKKNCPPEVMYED